MTFAQEGHALMLALVVASVLTFLAALKLRSWPLWLAAFGLAIVSLGVAWHFRVPGVIEQSGAASAPLLMRFSGTPTGHR